MAVGHPIRGFHVAPFLRCDLGALLCARHKCETWFWPQGSSDQFGRIRVCSGEAVTSGCKQQKQTVQLGYKGRYWKNMV